MQGSSQFGLFIDEWGRPNFHSKGMQKGVQEGPFVRAGSPLVLIGLVLCVTIIGIVPGANLIVAAAWPLYRAQKRALLKEVAYERRSEIHVHGCS